MKNLRDKLTFLRFVFKNLGILPRSEVSEIRTVFLCRHEAKDSIRNCKVSATDFLARTNCLHCCRKRTDFRQGSLDQLHLSLSPPGFTPRATVLSAPKPGYHINLPFRGFIGMSHSFSAHINVFCRARYLRMTKLWLSYSVIDSYFQQATWSVNQDPFYLSILKPATPNKIIAPLFSSFALNTLGDFFGRPPPTVVSRQHWYAAQLLTPSAPSPVRKESTPAV